MKLGALGLGVYRCIRLEVSESLDTCLLPQSLGSMGQWAPSESEQRTGPLALACVTWKEQKADMVPRATC